MAPPSSSSPTTCGWRRKSATTSWCIYAGRRGESGPARSLFSARASLHTLPAACQSIDASTAARALIATRSDAEPAPLANEISGCAFCAALPAWSLRNCRQATPPYGKSERPSASPASGRTKSAPLRRPDSGADRSRAVDPASSWTSKVCRRCTPRRNAGLFGGCPRRRGKERIFGFDENEFVAWSAKAAAARRTIGAAARRARTGSAEEPSALRARGRAQSRSSSRRTRRNMQMIFQDPQSALNPRRRVGAIVTQPMEAAGDCNARAAPGARPSTPCRNRPLAGYGQAVSLATLGRTAPARQHRTRLCASPKILIADEIVSGLDVSMQAQLLNLLLGCACSANFRCCSFPTTCRLCAICATACW